MEQRKNRSLARKIARILVKTVLFLFLFVLLVFLLVLTPPVQRMLTGKVENYLQKKLGTKVEIGSIRFGLSGNVSLKDVYFEDRKKDTLLAGGLLKAHLNFLRLFSNEVEVKDLELQNITAKIKRVSPDTSFNYQFIIDAFNPTTGKTVKDTTSAPMKLDISDLALENINLVYTDDITGNDLTARIGNLSATIDTLDPSTQHFDIPTLIARNVNAKVKQWKPVVTSDPLSTNIAEATTPIEMKLSIGTVDLSKIAVTYDNDISAFYTDINIGQLKTNERLIDLQNNKVWLNELNLANSKVGIRLGKKQEAKVVEKEVKEEVEAQKQAGWDFRIAKASLANNSFRFDNDNNPKQNYGMDYSHIDADSFHLDVDNFVMNVDSIGGNITRGSFREKSGFELDDLKGEVLYAYNQSYLKNLYLKTPGTEIQRNAVLTYASYDALFDEFEKTVLDLRIVESRVLVKDILTFAPQLRTDPAFADPDDTWYINIDGNGTFDRLNFNTLQFEGLRNTSINARGTLTGLSNPQMAGGNFTIEKLHTSQSDIALFTGQRLSNAQINLPEEFDLSGTVKGNSGTLNTALDIRTTSGNLNVNGNFSNLTSPGKASYKANIRTAGLRLGSIIRQPGTFGNLTGTFTVDGTGLTPTTMNTRFTGNIAALGYNKYTYHNAKLKGTLKGESFVVNADINDPNADLNLTASGNFSANSSFTINGMIDSIKTFPLHFTPDPMVFRGKIDGKIANIAADNPDADLLITKALFVSGNDRLALDTVQLNSGTNAAGNFVQLRSDLVNASIQGQYRLADLGNIITNSIQPYFTVTGKNTPVLKPYDFTFNADVIYSPIMSSFLPGLTTMENIHAEGNFATGGSMNATVTTPYLLYNGNELSNVNFKATTTANGLNITGNIARLKQGNSLDLYNARIDATALNNNIDFKVGIDDQNNRNKYHLSGLVSQPSAGTYAIRLKPDSLLLNYETWTVSGDNLITISPNNLTAQNFSLQKGNQRLTLNSLPGSPQPLQVTFNEFRVATLTGFVKSDSLLIDGIMNGEITFRNILQQPVFTSNLTVNDLSMKQDTIGNVALRVSSGNNGRYNIETATITGRGNDVTLNGSFAPVGNDVDLDLNLNVGQLQLNTMEGALANVISDASGSVNGKVTIKGTTSKPNIDGNLKFNNASFAMTLLGSRFRIDNEQLSVTDKGFVFDNFTIRDSANNQLNLNGNILTSNFINYDLNLDVTARNFELINSTKAKGKLYYGKLNISADAHIAGTETKPVVDGSLTVNDGTNLSVVIPQSETKYQEREGIVSFVDMDAPENDSLFTKAADSINKKNALGMDIIANIEIKKEAIFNIIVDEANGDFLNVRGEGVISTGIDPSGKITMVGTYALEEGSYQIAFNFLQRKFDIEKGSTITWTGEPTTAQLNVKAVYIANTSPIDLLGDQISAPTPAIRNTYRQKLPFEVILSLEGELMKPVIDFNIELPRNKNYGVSNDIVTAVDTKLDQMAGDEGEVNKQVFSLLLLGRFVGENPFKSSEGFSAETYARESVSKLLTEQLNNLAAGLFTGVDINFDLVSSDDYTTGERRNVTDLNVGLSKRLLNDRLKIGVGSNFMLEGSQETNRRSNNLANNISADYQLTKDGRYLLRFFRQNDYQGMVDGYVIETGISFIIAVDFNTFRQLIYRRKQRVTSEGTVQTSKQ